MVFFRTVISTPLRSNNAALAQQRSYSERAALALQRTIDVLSRLAKEEDFVPEVLRIVAHAFGARSCGFYEHSSDTIWLRYWWHDARVLGPSDLPNVDPEHLGTIARLARGFTVPISHLGVDSFTRKEPSLVDHRQGKGDVELQRFAVSMGWDRELNVPLNVEDKAIGALVIYRSEHEAFDAQDVALGSALAKQLALALQVSGLVRRERERVYAEEALRAAEERALLMDRAVSAMRRCSDSLLGVDEPRGAIVAALRASADVLASLGVIEIGLVELSLPARTVRCNLLLRGGEPVDIAGSELDRNWPIDEPPMSIVWKRASEGAPFVWGLTSETTVLVAEARAFHEAIGARAVGYVPLERAGEPVGWIAMSFRASLPPSEHQVSLVRALSTHVFLAIELERIAKQSRELALTKEREAAEQSRTAELAKANLALQSTIDALKSVEDLEDFVPAVVGIVSRAFGSASCALYETQGDNIWLRYWCTEGVVRGPDQILALDAVKWELIRVLAGGFTVPPEYLGDVRVSERSKTTLLDHRAGTPRADFDTFCCERGWDLEINTPVLVDGKPVGAMVINRGPDRPFTSSEIALAETLTAQLALAVEASRLATNARQRAVDNSRLEEVARSAEERAQLMDQTLAAMRRAADRLVDARKAAAVMAEALRAAVEVLAGQGVIDSGVVELDEGRRRLTFRAFIRNGREVSLDEPLIAREGSIDDDEMVMPGNGSRPSRSSGD